MMWKVSQAALLLTIGAASIAGQDLSCPATLDKSHEIDDKATLYYAVVPSNPPEANNGILCGRLEATNDGWVGLGFSENGSMSGSDAIIGLAGENMSVKKYDLTTTATEMAADKQTLRDTQCVAEDEKMKMVFTKLLVEEGEIPIMATGVNTFLHARGGADLGYHTNGRTPFEVDFGGADGSAPPAEIKVGDEVCITNYIMDKLCINLGYLLDNPSVPTLEGPEKHSTWCLVTKPECVESGYVVLTDKDEDTGMHCLGYRIEDSDPVLAAGRESSESKAPKFTVKGTVKELGDGSDGITGTPLLENVQVMDAGVACETTIVNPVCMEPPATVEPPPTPTPPTASGKDCSQEMCESQLDDKYLMRYQINVPDGTTLDVCDGCTISMELTYEGDAWVGIGFSTDGSMVGSEAVLGSSSVPVQKYNLAGKANSLVTPMPETQQTLTDTSVEVKDGQTIMKFTKIMKEDGEIEISPTDNMFIWAYGSSPALGYHAWRGTSNVNLSESPTEETSDEAKIGDQVCITNFIMDQYCINLGHFLDNDKVMTLEHPEEHSFHCLLDVGLCRDSGYAVLTDKDESTGMHCIGYRLDDSDAVYQAGIAVGQNDGYCTDCTGDETAPQSGYRATVKGTIKELGDGSDGPLGAPLLENIEVLDASVECDIPTVVNPVCMSSVTPPTPAVPVEPPTPAGPAKDCTKEMCENQLSDDYLMRYQINVPDGTTLDVCADCTISMELIYDGDSWVSIGFSTDGSMVGSDAVIGSSSLAVQKYNLDGKDTALVVPMPDGQQTLTDTSVEVKDGQTIMKFTKIMKEAGEVEISPADNTFIWAYGSSPTLGYHLAGRAALDLNLSSGASEEVAVPNMSAWLAHGIMAFIAWGVLVPFAVQSSLLRDLLPKGPLWFQLHRAFNTTAYATFIAVFAIGVAYTGKEGGTHFNNDHQKMGLSMFILASAQVLSGVFRPHVPAPNSGEEKTSLRIGFEIGHRVLGVALLACGFWQMQEGITLYAIKYSASETNEDKVKLAYWVWIGCMTAIIVIGGGFFKLRSKNADDEATPVAISDAPVVNVSEPDAKEDEAA